MHKVDQKFDFSAPIDAVFRCLTDAEEFASFSGMPAKFEAAPNAPFSLFSGYIKGCFLEIYPDHHRIVMAWRDCYNWKEGIYSIVNIGLEEIEGGTRMSWTQHGVPASEVDHMGVGLGRKYFNSMAKYLSSGEVQDATPDSCKIRSAA